MSRSMLLGLGLLLAGCLSISEADTESGNAGSDAQAGAGGTGWASGGTGAASGVGGAPDASTDAGASDGGPCSPENPQLLDDFNQQDGPLQASWSGNLNAFTVVGGSLVHTTTNLDDRILFDKTLCSAQTVSVRLTKVGSSTGLMGVLFAQTTNKDCDLVQIGHSGAQQAILVQKCINGQWTDLMTTSWQVVDGDVLEARLDGAGVLDVRINGTQVGSVQLGAWPGSHPGIATYLGGKQIAFDDFRGG